MAYRNGTYIAFHAEGKTDPTASDIKYYRTLKMWHANDDIDFKFINSHDKVAAVRDSSSKETIMRSLRARLDSSKNMVLIVGETTKNDRDFVPYEIQYAVDTCGLPIFCVYTKWRGILSPSIHKDEWPPALASRIANKTAAVIHMPFKQGLIDHSIKTYSITNMPSGPLVHYKKEFQEKHGVKF